MAEEKEMKEKPEVEKAANIAAVKKLSKKQKSHPNLKMLGNFILFLAFLGVIFIILSNTSVLRNAIPEPGIQTGTSAQTNQTAQNSSAASSAPQNDLAIFSNANYGISFSYPNGFEMKSHVSKDISLIPLKSFSSSTQAPIIITKTPLAAASNVDKYMQGTMITLGYPGQRYDSITLSDGTPARLLKANITRSLNSKKAYLLVFAYQQQGYYLYYLAPVMEYDQTIAQVEGITNSIKLIK